MDSLIGPIIAQIMHGGQEIIAFLLLLVGLLIWDRKRLTKEITRKDERLEKIVDEYYKGNISLAEALTSLKHVLFEIRTKL